MYISHLHFVPDFVDDESSKLFKANNDALASIGPLSEFVFEQISPSNKIGQRSNKIRVPKFDELVSIGRHEPLERMTEEHKFECFVRHFWREI